MDRKSIYAAIDTEREYQDLQWGGAEHNDKHEIESFLMYTEHYLDKAKTILCTEDMTKKLHRKHTMDNIRKATALLVCTMEKFGVDPRPEWELNKLRETRPAVKQYIVCMDYQTKVVSTWEFSEVLWKQIGEEIKEDLLEWYDIQMHHDNDKGEITMPSSRHRGKTYHLIEATSIKEAEIKVLEQYGKYMEDHNGLD
jgi:hypothetical protein